MAVSYAQFGLDDRGLYEKYLDTYRDAVCSCGALGGVHVAGSSELPTFEHQLGVGVARGGGGGGVVGNGAVCGDAGVWHAGAHAGTAGGGRSAVLGIAAKSGRGGLRTCEAGAGTRSVVGDTTNVDGVRVHPAHQRGPNYERNREARERRKKAAHKAGGRSGRFEGLPQETQDALVATQAKRLLLENQLKIDEMTKRMARVGSSVSAVEEVVRLLKVADSVKAGESSVAKWVRSVVESAVVSVANSAPRSLASVKSAVSVKSSVSKGSGVPAVEATRGVGRVETAMRRTAGGYGAPGSRVLSVYGKKYDLTAATRVIDAHKGVAARLAGNADSDIASICGVSLDEVKLVRELVRVFS